MSPAAATRPTQLHGEPKSTLGGSTAGGVVSRFAYAKASPVFGC
jgi:hypothetical protein